MTGVATDTDTGALCRSIVRSADRATLATVSTTGKAGADGPWAYASLVLSACDCDGSPLLLISDLADHTRNLRADSRVSLLYDGTAGFDEALSGPRVTLQGRAEPVTEERLMQRYLRRHPSAALYAGFNDFHLFRIRIERAHLVAGFGRIEWLTASDLLLETAVCRMIEADEASVLDRWNEDDGGLFDVYARGLLRRRGKGWRAVGFDPEGVDIRRGGALARIEFRSPIATVGEALAELRQRVGAS